MICKRCQAELPEGQRFCPTCGALQPMICPACGAESRAGSRTCSACGKKLPMAEREDKLVYTKRKKNGSNLAVAVITLGALLILGGAAMFLFSTLNEIGKDDPVVMQQQTGQDTEKKDPVETKPEETKPEETKPEETKPEETKPEETKPEETKPEETKPEETKPEETKPEETKPEETKPEETKPEETKPEETKPADSEWFFADSDSRLLTEDDIAGMTAEELKLARNEIYARHGRRFNSASLQAHFDSCSWYQGTIAPEVFDEGVFNEVELANIAFLKAAE